jgi:DAK2 domain fusion protein YloV
MSVDTQAAHQTKRITQLRQRPVDGQALKKLVEAGLQWLRTNQETVNSLNVFPVPDGDTGTNMVLTMQSAYDEIVNSPERNFGKMINAVAHGALMGARGNSGVILSQLLRGFSRSVGNNPILETKNLVEGLSMARDTAYKGVVRPVEGTILTVSKDIAAAANAALRETDDIIQMLEEIVEAADQSVKHTPELLPVLKDAGVVDSGGKGLFYILEGMLRFIYGQPLDSKIAALKPLGALELENTLETIEPGQDYEVVIDFQPDNELDLESYYNDLEKMGTSIQLGEGDGMYRMHIHVPTENRYEPIDYTMSIGTITKVAIENLMVQMEQIQSARGGNLPLAPVEPGQIAVVAVSPGPGIARVFASLGVAALVEGGQSMNPSTQELLHSFENLPTEKIIILPNNKNILMAARSASSLTVKNVAVVPSVSVPQGLAAMMRLTPQGDFEAVVEEMNASLAEVETGEITTATRNAEIDGVSVEEGQVIALHNDRLVAAAYSLEEALLGFLKTTQAQQYELITLFYGDELSKPEVIRLTDIIREAYPEQEVEVQEGGQPHYQFIISIE